MPCRFGSSFSARSVQGPAVDLPPARPTGRVPVKTLCPVPVVCRGVLHTYVELQ